jgi:hypothetical protein
MSFWFIWTERFFTFRERLIRTRDWATQKTASALPLRVRYWVTLQEIGRATMDSHDVPATSVEEVLRKLDKPKVVR